MSLILYAFHLVSNILTAHSALTGHFSCVLQNQHTPVQIICTPRHFGAVRMQRAFILINRAVQADFRTNTLWTCQKGLQIICTLHINRPF